MEKLNFKLDEETNREWLCGNCGADLTRHKDANFCPVCGLELDWKGENNEN